MYYTRERPKKVNIFSLNPERKSISDSLKLYQKSWILVIVKKIYSEIVPMKENRTKIMGNM